MRTPLQGKTALITGGSRGIGRVIETGLAAKDAAVAIGYLRNETRANKVVKAVLNQPSRSSY